MLSASKTRSQHNRKVKRPSHYLDAEDEEVDVVADVVVEDGGRVNVGLAGILEFANDALRNEQ